MTDEIFFEDLRLGQKASFGKTITESDIVLFAAVTGDTNPMHLNADYAKGSIFGERIAHGMLAAGLITKVLGDRKSTRLNSSHANISYAVFCLKKKKNNITTNIINR